jgi:hypothetical protein
MVLFGQNFDIPIGRTGLEGKLRLYLFAGDMLAMTVDGRTERTPTVLLNLEQARQLRNAVDQLIVSCEAATSPEEKVSLKRVS